MPNPEPLVSILIPVYNRPELIRRALDSALAQTYPNFEVVVCDNCSTDETFAVVQEYMRGDSRVCGYQNPSNLGPVKNWIRCVQLSKGEFVRILFSDDWLEPQAIEQMVRPMIANPDVGFCYSAVEMNEPHRHFPVYQLDSEGLMLSTEFLRILFSGTDMGAPVSPGCAMFRRADALEFIPEKLPTYKGFDVNQYGVGNDVTIYLRACAKYSHCFHIRTPLTNFLSHPESFSVRIINRTPNFLGKCYWQAFSYFLANERSAIPKRSSLWLTLHWYRTRMWILELLETGSALKRRILASSASN